MVEIRAVGLELFDHERHSELLLRWVRRPHVARWWGSAERAMDHAARCGPETQAIIVADVRPVGYVCWRKPAREELEAAGIADLADGLVDIDIFVGEPDWLGRGIGSRALGLLLARLRNDPTIHFAGLGTSSSNQRAILAFERAGFRLYREFLDPRWGDCRYLVAEVRRGFR